MLLLYREFMDLLFYHVLFIIVKRAVVRLKYIRRFILPKSKDREKDFYDVTQELVVILEHEIISHPEMWFWVHDRWKDGRERFAVRK